MTNRLVTLISVGDHLTAMFQLGKQDLSQQLDIKLFYLAFELLLERLAESIGKGYLAVPFLKKMFDERFCKPVASGKTSIKIARLKSVAISKE